MGLPTAGYIGGRCVKWLTRIELSAGGQAHVHLACCGPEQEMATGKQMHLATSSAATCILHRGVACFCFHPLVAEESQNHYHQQARPSRSPQHLVTKLSLKDSLEEALAVDSHLAAAAILQAQLCCLCLRRTTRCCPPMWTRSGPTRKVGCADVASETGRPEFAPLAAH